MINRKDGAPELRPRVRVIYCSFSWRILGCHRGLVVLQAVHGERYTFLSENNRIRIKRILGTRGMIYDRQRSIC